MRGILLLLSSLLLMSSPPEPGAKTKHKSKTFTPVVSAKLQAYAGHYVGIDSTYFVDVKVEEDSSLAVTLHDGPATSALDNVRLEGAHLTATLTTDGRGKPFDAVFGERNLNGRKVFGLVVNQDIALTDDMTLSRLFCTRQ